MVQAQVNNDASARDTETACGESPLMIAALNGSFDVVEWLHKNGASLSVTAPNGNTMVHYSAASGCPRTLQYILAQEGIQYINSLNKVKVISQNGNDHYTTQDAYTTKTIIYIRHFMARIISVRVYSEVRLLLGIMGFSAGQNILAYSGYVHLFLPILAT